MTKKSNLGKLGEDFACEYLVKNGYKIIERNYRKFYGELDIIALAPDKTLVFVEVKTVSEKNSLGLKPEDQMSYSKIEKFKKIAIFYANVNDNLIDNKKGWRLDLIALIANQIESLTKSNERFVLKHYQNI